MANEDAKRTTFMNSSELAVRAAQEEREFNAACPWKLNTETMVVYVPQEGDRSYYEVDLEDCTSSAPILDWIAQVSQKPWIDDATRGALVRKLDQLLDVQATVCGGGTDRTLDPVAHMRSHGRLK